jgi:hypothetical protein
MICNSIFLAVEQIRLKQKDEELALSFTNYLFERLADYWSLDLLKDGKDITGISYWHEILEITKKWEDSNELGIKIHKGTPYYFLAENYLLVGNRDLAFVYLFNAIGEDRNVGKLIPSLSYPKGSPASITATMNKNPLNHMRFIVEKLRNMLDGYLTSFHTNLLSHSSFSLHDFDTKFLENDSLLDIVAFFVSNFMCLYDFKETINTKEWQNDFSRLRSLDLFFNVGLIIDEVLKEAYRKHNGGLLPNHFISNSILWLCDSSQWMSQSNLKDFWGPKDLNLNDEDPDKIVPDLISRSRTYRGNAVREEVFVLLIAYKFRNYAGHNIKQQSVVTSHYEDIISNLIFALFLAIEKL